MVALGGSVKAGRLFCDPANEVSHVGVRAQRVPRVVGAFELFLRERSVNRLVTYAMHPKALRAAATLGYEMVPIGIHPVDDGARAKRTCLGS
jgi:hypothetical protein